MAQHLRSYLRLATDLKFFSVNQYEHAARLVDELGRLVGGRQRSINGALSAPGWPPRQPNRPKAGAGQ